MKNRSKEEKAKRKETRRKLVVKGRQKRRVDECWNEGRIRARMERKAWNRSGKRNESNSSEKNQVAND
jgi:hypothetical protein